MPAIWGVAGWVVASLGSTAIWVLLYLFPAGHFVPRWTRMWVAVFVVLQLMMILRLPFNYMTRPAWRGVPIPVWLLVSGVRQLGRCTGLWWTASATGLMQRPSHFALM